MGDNGAELASMLWPRVSTILRDLGLAKTLPDLPAIEWGRARGTAVHKAIHLFEDGLLDPRVPLHPDVAGRFRGYVAFKVDTGYKPEAYEEPVSHAGLRFRGTLDSRGPYQDMPAILDFKCGSVDKKAAELQLAAYAIAVWGETEALKCPRYVVELGEDSYRVHDLTTTKSVVLFASAVRVWWAQKA